MIAPPLDPRALRASCDRAMLAHQAGRLAEARGLYAAVLAKDPDHFDALHLCGLLLAQTGEGEAGVALMRRAIALDPNFAEAHANLGEALRAIGKPDEAMVAFDAALALKPGLDSARKGRDAALDEVVAAWRRIIATSPRSAEAHSNLGTALLELGRADEALACYGIAVGLDPALLDARYNRGVALQRLGRLAEALADYDAVIGAQPEHALALGNRALALQGLGRYEAALAGYDAAIAQRPDYVDARLNRGMARLLLGRFEEGWPDYEWRGGPPARREAKAWRGEADVAGRRLWLRNEQGLGDTIQFARYAKLLARRGAQVKLSVQAPLKPLFEGFEPGVAVVAAGEPPPAFDLVCPLLSLPLALGTRLETIPAWPRYLASDPARRAAVNARLGPRTRPRVGLVWSGSTTLRRDADRSIPFARLAPMLDDSHEWHALQIEVRERDAAVFRNFGRVRFHGEALRDFADTAALVEAMDLVISVDTSVAHLAGALGKPVWVLLPFDPDWRWLLGRGDSPWYPSARLFRQSAPGDWESVLAAVRAGLG